jgi:predicted AlkP superfamily phosphohydrolase/phosphomutase
MPPWLQRHATAFAMPYLRNRIGRAPPQACPDYIEPSERARQRFFLEPNNYVMGGIRLNLIGREPSGHVAPDEVDVVCRRLADDLLALVNVETGDRVVRSVERADRWYRRSSADKFPDLFVEWENSAPIETVWSPKIGLLHSPTTHWRSGDHRPDGLLLACGPGIPASRSFPEIDVEDIGPSIAARLGVELSDVDGSAAPWLSRPH